MKGSPRRRVSDREGLSRDRDVMRKAEEAVANQTGLVCPKCKSPVAVIDHQHQQASLAFELPSLWASVAMGRTPQVEARE